MHDFKTVNSYQFKKRINQFYAVTTKCQNKSNQKKQKADHQQPNNTATENKKQQRVGVLAWTHFRPSTLIDLQALELGAICRLIKLTPIHNKA